MKITNLRTNHIENPLGFALGQPSLSWIVEDTNDRLQKAAQVTIAKDEQFTQIVYNTGSKQGRQIDSLGFKPELELSPRTRYYWKARVWGESEAGESETAWFETAKREEEWFGQWITPDFENNQIHPILYKTFELPAEAVSARLYICGLGLYECHLNGTRVGSEYLTPYCNAYDRWLQYQTFDITGQLRHGENQLNVMLGNGWYKGRYGLPAIPGQIITYGDQFALICELHILLTDGTEITVSTDDSWKAVPAPVVDSSIYDGETVDARISASNAEMVYKTKVLTAAPGTLEERRSLPVSINEAVQPQAVLHTPAGETVLDMGQNMVGWIRFRTHAPAGTKIHLQFGEVLQGGNFFRDNLRSARAEFIYIADGNKAEVEPHFTFFGFRYVKVTGWHGEIDPRDFTGCVVYSRMDMTGSIETSNEKVNKLFQNALWGQKGNFLDIPTDCPQRDERLGWTGDAQMFSGTACLNMDSAAFFAKWTYDLFKEQEKFDGAVPFVVPQAHSIGAGSSAWGDAATIVPWNVYEIYGDRNILAQQFESMRAWVDFILKADESSGGKRLWTVGFHFGDWLALDGSDPNSPMGGTPEDFIASAYYYYSARFVARTAAVLGGKEDGERYELLAKEIKAAIHKEYFTPTGRLAIPTQTGYVLALFMDLAPQEFRSRLVEDLMHRLKSDRLHLRTGFVGTPYLCRVLSNHGANEMAYQLLLNEDYPSWLYAVNLGATTIWERWNSLNPEGAVSSTGMNSFNHYAYGSIVEWMYRDMCGLNPSNGDDQVTGFRHARLSPKPDKALRFARARCRTAAGWYESGWAIDKQGNLAFNFSIPFNATATLVLPDAPSGEIFVNGDRTAQGRQTGSCVEMELPAGTYHIEYHPLKPYIEVFSTHTPIVRLVRCKKVVDALKDQFPMITMVDENMLTAIGDASIRQMAQSPYVQLTETQLNGLDLLLKQIET
jgi:alpha-L-rhamnosidase